MTIKGVSVGLLAGLTAGLILAPPAGADTFRPTRFDDPPPGVCKAHDCSLREAISAADKEPNHSTILLDKGTYRIEIPPGSPEEKTGDFDLFRPATITGKGPKKTKISGGFLDRVFDLDPSSGTELPKHTFRGLTIERGAAQPLGLSSGDNGGGIEAFISNLKLDHVVVRNNSAPDGGGGISAFRAELAIADSTISGNSAASGGGIYLPNGAVIPNTARIKRSTISGNTAQVGGGLALDGGALPSTFDQMPFADVVNSTFAGNEAGVSGGGFSAIQGGLATVASSTFAHNGADVDNSGGGEGGGLYQSTSAAVHLDNSIIAANTVGSSGLHPQCSGTFPGDGNVLEPQPDGCDITTLFVADAMIGPLVNNGGPTKTFALLEGSPAIGRALACPKTDQRGEKRPDDCDSGAFERKKSDP